MKKGRLKIFYGPMYSGKSAYMIRDILGNIDSAKLVFKPKGDVRSESLYTRQGLVFEAIAVNNASEIKAYIKHWVRIVYIDEVNFFGTGIADVVMWIIDQGIDVVVSGLDKDFRRVDFPESKKIIDAADVSVKLKAKCHVCGASSAYTARYINGVPAPKDSPVILSDGANDKVDYKTVCDEHHPFTREEAMNLN